MTVWGGIFVFGLQINLTEESNVSSTSNGKEVPLPKRLSTSYLWEKADFVDGDGKPVK